MSNPNPIEEAFLKNFSVSEDKRFVMLRSEEGEPFIEFINWVMAQEQAKKGSTKGCLFYDPAKNILYEVIAFNNRTKSILFQERVLGKEFQQQLAKLGKDSTDAEVIAKRCKEAIKAYDKDIRLSTLTKAGVLITEEAFLKTFSVSGDKRFVMPRTEGGDPGIEFRNWVEAQELAKKGSAKGFLFYDPAKNILYEVTGLNPRTGSIQFQERVLGKQFQQQLAKLGKDSTNAEGIAKHCKEAILSKAYDKDIRLSTLTRNGVLITEEALLKKFSVSGDKRFVMPRKAGGEPLIEFRQWLIAQEQAKEGSAKGCLFYDPAKNILYEVIAFNPQTESIQFQERVLGEQFQQQLAKLGKDSTDAEVIAKHCKEAIKEYDKDMRLSTLTEDSVLITAEQHKTIFYLPRVKSHGSDEIEFVAFSPSQFIFPENSEEVNAAFEALESGKVNIAELSEDLQESVVDTAIKNKAAITVVNEFFESEKGYIENWLMGLVKFLPLIDDPKHPEFSKYSDDEKELVRRFITKIQTLFVKNPDLLMKHDKTLPELLKWGHKYAENPNFVRGSAEIIYMYENEIEPLTKKRGNPRLDPDGSQRFLTFASNAFQRPMRYPLLLDEAIRKLRGKEQSVSETVTAVMALASAMKGHASQLDQNKRMVPQMRLNESFNSTVRSILQFVATRHEIFDALPEKLTKLYLNLSKISNYLELELWLAEFQNVLTTHPQEVQMKIAEFSKFLGSIQKKVHEGVENQLKIIDAEKNYYNDDGVFPHATLVPGSDLTALFNLSFFQIKQICLEKNKQYARKLSNPTILQRSQLLAQFIVELGKLENTGNFIELNELLNKYQGPIGLDIEGGLKLGGAPETLGKTTRKDFKKLQEAPKPKDPPTLFQIGLRKTREILARKFQDPIGLGATKQLFAKDIKARIYKELTDAYNITTDVTIMSERNKQKSKALLDALNDLSNTTMDSLDDLVVFMEKLNKTAKDGSSTYKMSIGKDVRVKLESLVKEAREQSLKWEGLKEQEEKEVKSRLSTSSKKLEGEEQEIKQKRSHSGSTPAPSSASSSIASPLSPKVASRSAPSMSSSIAETPTSSSRPRTQTSPSPKVTPSSASSMSSSTTTTSSSRRGTETSTSPSSTSARPSGSSTTPKHDEMKQKVSQLASKFGSPTTSKQGTSKEDKKTKAQETTPSTPTTPSKGGSTGR